MKLLLQLAAAVQLLILIASALTPRVLDWRKNLAALDPFLRRLFWVYGVGYHALTFTFAFLALVYGKAAL